MKTTMDRRTFLGGLLVAPLAFFGTRAQAATHNVMIEGFAFSPATLDVSVGDTVVFTNADNAPHTGTAEDGSFDTGRLNNGQSGEVTIGSAGDHPYKCAFHPAMQGLIRAT
ncbi:cupredoxin domain-containing protein [Octadecabacter sp. SW4]|uniref:cupredoxin domain-containing protein n=1 Tax=Octadecabacter sp. SW4 TaxID=2602067 RepID=UPI0018D98016|nr:cupredoxin domain-containing protein [Octadecabacter sp. SW4]